MDDKERNMFYIGMIQSMVKREVQYKQDIENLKKTNNKYKNENKKLKKNQKKNEKLQYDNADLRCIIDTRDNELTTLLSRFSTLRNKYDASVIESNECDNLYKISVTLNKSIISDLLEKNKIHNAKIERQKKGIEQLRLLNTKILTKMKETRVNYNNKKNDINKQLENAKKNIKQQMNDLERGLIKQFDADAKKQNDEIQAKINKNRQYELGMSILNKYSAFDRYIADVCFKYTGLKRNFDTYPYVYNNIHDFVKLPNIDKFVKETLNVSIEKFKNIFLLAKRERNRIAHPYVSEDNVFKCVSGMMNGME